MKSRSVQKKRPTSLLTLLSFQLCVAALSTNAIAESTKDLAVPEITVMGDTDKTSPLDFVPTVSELSGSRLSRKKASSLGETLSRETGVTSSQFGPNSSRPVIRGLDGERIRILENGTGTLDASAASQDHAVSLDPLAIERIEIVRGPSALLYGSSAVGGVVNIVTRRIPETKIDFIRGTFESRFSSVDNGRSSGLFVEGPVSKTLSKWQFHVDAGARAADDYKIPGFARTAASRAANPVVDEDNNVVSNSFNRTLNGAVGTSFVDETSFAGVSYSKYNSQYGTVAEKGVNINLRQQRFDFAGGVKNIGWFDSVKLKSTFSDYQHEEIEDGVIGTTFKNRGNETRIDLKQKRAGLIDGFVGAQSNIFAFEALGDEAFIPKTNNSSLAAFLFEEMDLGLVKPSFGFRIDRTTVASEVASDKIATFGASESKAFTATSASLGFDFPLGSDNSIVLNTSLTERAPNYEELFANGAHVATGVFEVGDRNLGKETSKAIELSARTKTDRVKGSFGVFAQDFDNFVALTPTGTTDINSGLPISNYLAVPARLIGAELEYRYTMSELFLGGVLELELKADTVRGFNRSTGTSLPRIPAVRETIGLVYKADRLQADIEIQRTEKQSQLAVNELETPAYHLVNLGAELPFRFDGYSLSLNFRALNLFDVEARNHVSVLKEIAPLPGRSLNLGIQAMF